MADFIIINNVTKLVVELIYINQAKTQFSLACINMATIIKSFLELTYLPTILIAILFTFILLNLYLLKTVLRWWRTRPKIYAITMTSRVQEQTSISNRVKKQNERCLGKQIIKAYCFLQPCFTNASVNKCVITVLLSISAYVVFCTQFTYAMQDYRSGVKQCADRIVGLGAWFGWSLVLGALIDFIIRMFLAKNVVDRNKTKSEQQKIEKKEVVSKNQSNSENKKENDPLDCWIISYYSVLTILTICLTLLSINSILLSNQNNSIASKSRNSLSSSNTQQIYKLNIVSIIDLFVIYLLNHIVFAFVSALLYPILGSFKLSPKFQIVWRVAYGCSVENSVFIGSLNRKRQVVPQFEQSKENIGEITEFNNIQNLIFTQTIQAPTKQKYIFNSSTKVTPNPKLISTQTFGSTQNTNEKQGKRKGIKTNPFDTVEQNEHLNMKMKMRKRKQILLTQSQLNVVEVKAKINQNQNRKKEILATKCRSLDVGNIGVDNCQEVASNTQHRYQKQQKAQTKRPRSLFIQDQILKTQTPTPTQKQKNKQMIISSTKEQKKADEQSEFNQDILGNIENRISVASSFKKKKNIKQGLNVVNCAENQIQIQHVDLSKYSIYNLGHAQSKTIDYKPILDFKKKNSLPPLNMATPTSKQHQVGEYNWSSKKKSIKSPCVSDMGAEAFTFCLHDIHVNSKPQ